MKKLQLVPIQNYQQQAEKIFEVIDVNEATRADYKYRIKLFLDFISVNGLNRNSFLEFKRSLAARADFAVSTKNKYLITAKIFLKELSRLGMLPDITQNVKSFTQSHKHKRDGLNEEEMALVAQQLKQLTLCAESARLRAIIALLALQGLRQVEIIRLDVKDLDLVNKTAFIVGKGQDDKELINLHPETVRALQVYLKINKVSDGALFVSKSNNSFNRRLTTRALRQIISQKLEDLGIEKTVHGFRHYFTTKLIQTYKGDLLEVARYTRHKSLEMLQVYNDNIKIKADLPRFYRAFENLAL